MILKNLIPVLTYYELYMKVLHEKMYKSWYGNTSGKDYILQYQKN